jgi:predicted MFS family arabinose efflux permease
MVTLARLLGPAAAGILLSSFGEGICFLINFLSFIAVIGSLLFMKIKVPERKKHEEPIWKGLQEGYSYLKQSLGLKSAILLMSLTSLFVMPYSTLFPVYAQTIFKGNVTTFSWLNSISGLGALIGAVYIANLKTGTNLLKLIAFSSLLLAISLILFSHMHQLTIALFFIMLGEIGMLAQIAATNTFVQTNVDERMRGRVLSYYVMAFLGMQPIGSLIIGFVAHVIGAQLTVMLEGVAGVIAVLMFIPTLKRARIMAEQKQTIAEVM